VIGLIKRKLLKHVEFGGVDGWNWFMLLLRPLRFILEVVLYCSLLLTFLKTISDGDLLSP